MSLWSSLLECAPAPATAAAAAAGAVVAAVAMASRVPRRRPFRMPAPGGPREPGVVYLHMFPRWKFSPNISPFGLRLETYLRLARVPYVAVLEDVPTGPNAKMPWVELDGEAIADTELIIERLERRFAPGLAASPAGHAVSVMLCERSYWVGLHNRWVRHLDIVFRDELPVSLPMRVLLRLLVVPDVERSGWGHGIFRHSEEDMDEMLRRDFGAAHALLGDAPFFGGDRPDAADATVAAFVSCFVSDAFPHPAKAWIRDDFPRLLAHFDRVRALAFPDWGERILAAPAGTVYRGPPEGAGD